MFGELAAHRGPAGIGAQVERRAPKFGEQTVDALNRPERRFNRDRADIRLAIAVKRAVVKLRSARGDRRARAELKPGRAARFRAKRDVFKDDRHVRFGIVDPKARAA